MQQTQHYQKWNSLLSKSNRFIQKESDIIQSVIRILIYSKTWYAQKAGHLLRAVVYPEMYAEASFAIIDSNDDVCVYISYILLVPVTYCNSCQ